MHDTYEELAKRAIKLLSLSNAHRVAIVLVGPPGSGKSTIAAKIADKINMIDHSGGPDLGNFSNNDGVSGQGEVHGLDLLKEFLDSIPDNGEPCKDFEEDNFNSYKKVFEDRIEIYGKGGEHTKITIRLQSQQSTTTTTTTTTTPTTTELCQMVPMDGFHLTRAQLAQFRDPEKAILRRGAPHTFDNVNLSNLTKLIKISLSSTASSDNAFSIEIPSFDHALKDPIPNSIKIYPSTRIILLEGLYFLLQSPPSWKQISDVFDHNPTTTDKHQNSFINNTAGQINHDIPISFESLKQRCEFWKIHVSSIWHLGQRIALRHLQTGIVTSLQEGEDQFKLNDALNGEFVIANSRVADLNIHSIDQAEQKQV